MNVLPRYGSIFDIDSKKILISEKEKEASDPNFWSDSKKAEQQMKLIQNEKKILNDFYTVESLINDLEVLNEFYQKKEIDYFIFSKREKQLI